MCSTCRFVSTLVVVAILAVPIFQQDSLAQITPQGASAYVSPNLPASVPQYNPRVASDGNNLFLVVWEQGADTWETTQKQICAALISGQTTSGGFVLKASSGSQKFPKVAYGNGVFLVVWQEYNGTDYDIVGVLVDSKGQVMADPGKIEISAAAYNQISPDLTYDARDGCFFVVWADFRDDTNYRIYGARVNTSGQVLDTNGVLLSQGWSGFAPYTPVIGYNGQNFLVAWVGRAFEGYLSRLGVGLYSPTGSLIKMVSSDSVSTIVGRYVQHAKFPALGCIVQDPSNKSFGLFTHFIYGPVDKYKPAGGFEILSDGTFVNQASPVMIDTYETTFSVSAVFTGSYFLVAWDGMPSMSERVNSSTKQTILASRVSTDLSTALDYAAPVQISDEGATESSYNPSIALAVNNNVLVVYEYDNLLDYPNGSHLLKWRLVTVN